MRSTLAGTLLFCMTLLMVVSSCAQQATVGPPTTGPPPERSPTPQPTATETAPPTPTETVTPPPPTATPTMTQPPTHTPGPRILAFQITPTVTANVGDVLAMSWQATGERAEICPVGALGPIEQLCRAVSI